MEWKSAVVIELSEQTVIEEMVERLTRSYPGGLPERVAEVVRRSHARFDGRPIRDYVPLFVEREFRRELVNISV
jgi:hypothetical protein